MNKKYDCAMYMDTFNYLTTNQDIRRSLQCVWNSTKGYPYIHSPVSALALGTFEKTYVMRSSKNFIVILHTFDIRKSLFRGEECHFVKNDEGFNFFKAKAEYRLLTPQENIFYAESAGYSG
jgi:hypothetical protein